MLKGHGGNLFEVAKRFNVSSDSIVDFSASVNSPIPVSAVNKWARDAIKLANVYPDPEYRVLRKNLATKYCVREKEILPCNGSSEALYLALRALKPKRVLIVAPSYADYADACRFAGAKVEYLLLEEINDFSLDLTKLSKMIPKFDLVILGNPNNPTGGATDKKELLRLISKNSSALFILDEAFIDFIPECSLLNSLRPNLLVLRSLTKFYGIPGLRIGFAAAKADLISRLMQFREPWSINCLAEYFAIKICNGALSETHIVKKAKNERKRLFEVLSSLPAIKVYPTRANFFLIRILKKKVGSEKLQAKLIKKGALIRDCSNFHGLNSSFFRVAIKKRSENDFLAKLLKDTL